MKMDFMIYKTIGKKMDFFFEFLTINHNNDYKMEIFA